MTRDRTVRTQNLYIDGRWIPSAHTRATFDKWTGESTGAVAVADASHARAAVDAAQRAMDGAPLTPSQRASILDTASRLIADRSEQFAALITTELGKPITASRQEVGRAAETLRVAAEEARRLPGERVPLDAVPTGDGTFAFTIPVARGIVAAITPFNFPLNLVLHKVAPAIAAGCAVVLKPSDHSPHVAALLVELLEEAGLPAGWLNLVTGPPEEIVGAWQSDDRVAVITFTGSARVGWAIKAASPRKLHVLELGSNTAMVVMDDADVATAARAARDSALANSGQACVSLQRVYVQSAIAERFLAELDELVAEVTFGDPRLDSTVVGPLITDAAQQKLLAWVTDAVDSGARIVTGGTVANTVMVPTVMTDVSSDHPLLREEAFGPIVTVVPFQHLDDAVRFVNSSDYALNTAIYTSQLATAMEYSTRAEAGSVLVNMPASFRADHMPYGGVKGSGQGREGVKYAIADLLQEKLVVLHP